MKLDEFLDVPDRSPTFYALLAVMLLEALAVVSLERYVDRTETLPPTYVLCRHNVLTNCQDIFVYGSAAQAGVVLTNVTNINVTNIYWIRPATNQP